MAKAVSAEKIGIDLDAVLDGALANPNPKGRMLTKTQQLRDRREKLIALQAKGYTEVELAKMTGVSKDTLRKALHPESSTKQKKQRRSDHITTTKKQDQIVSNTPQPVNTVAGITSDEKPLIKKQDQKVISTPPRVAGDKKSFPTKDRF
jgi:hypothetical protein